MVVWLFGFFPCLLRRYVALCNTVLLRPQLKNPHNNTNESSRPQMISLRKICEFPQTILVMSTIWMKQKPKILFCFDFMNYCIERIKFYWKLHNVHISHTNRHTYNFSMVRVSWLLSFEPAWLISSSTPEEMFFETRSIIEINSVIDIILNDLTSPFYHRIA